MQALNKDGFIGYISEQWTSAGFDVSEASEAPYKELVKSLQDGFSFGLSVMRGDGGPGCRARVGVWFRPVPGGLGELGPLRAHYQQKIQQRGRPCRIHNCSTELGTFFLFWETTSPLPEESFSQWAQLVEELSGLCFSPEALDGYLGEYR